MNRLMRNVCILAAIVFLNTIALVNSASAQIAQGNLVVLRVGDGTSALVNSGGMLNLLQFDSAGVAGTTTAIASSSLQLSGTATSEGAVTITPDGSKIVIAGYNASSVGGTFGGTGSLSSRTAAQAPRAYGTVDVASGNYTFGATFAGTGTDYSAGNMRSATIANGNVYGAGSVQGTVLAGSSPTVIQSSQVNTRVVQSISGDLYYATGSGVQGIYKIAGTPTTATAPTAFITGLVGQGTSPYAFAISPGVLTSGSIAYVADTGIGVQKFTYDGTVWSLAYNITTGAGTTGLGVDFSGANPIIHANNPTSIFKFTDTGSAGAASIIATSGTNFAFRGLAFVTPVPEPGTVLAISAAAVALVGAARRRRRGEPVLA